MDSHYLSDIGLYCTLAVFFAIIFILPFRKLPEEKMKLSLHSERCTTYWKAMHGILVSGGPSARITFYDNFFIVARVTIQPNVPIPGQLTLSAANQHWQDGNGAPLNIDISTLDLSNVQLPANSLYRAQPNFDGSSFSSANDAFVYGTVTLYPGPNNTVVGGYDTYNFDYKDWSLSTAPRNISTFFAKVIAGNGTPYKINFTGTGQVGKTASGSGASNATNQAANAAAAAVNSAMDNINSILSAPVPSAPVSSPSSGTTYPCPACLPSNFNDEQISAADGGFILYPNMSNTSQIQSVYSKH
ncbi:hypothetical protein [Methylomonas sp. AM2-LC]|uniref:hypothetical protein n=1 Tax=Methylomonas sp. AM2-LC TaxID=3153301 RepID=UPI003262E342